MITTHQLPADVFAALATDHGGDPDAVRYLLDAQHSKHLMLLHFIAAKAGNGDPAAPETAAFQNALTVLRTVQKAAPATFDWVTGLPHIGAWSHACLELTIRGSRPEFGYLAAVAAAAAVRGGVPFELDVPVNDGKAALPGLGHFEDVSQRPWVRLHSDGGQLSVGAFGTVPCSAIAADDGTAQGVPRWRGSPLLRLVARGQQWPVLLETGDPHLDCFDRPMSTAMTTTSLESWRSRLQSAWEVLVRHHNRAAQAIAAGVSVIVPLTVPRSTDLDSATSPAAFGAIATSLPPDPVILAETLVHEFQHLKLCGLMDMVALTQPSDDRVYAPWRQDPRPADALLQGVYAHLGIARFWAVQRHAEQETDKIFRAEVLLDRWRRTIEPSIAAMLRADCLTPEGMRFADLLRQEALRLGEEPVPPEATAVADDIALDHWLAWQLRHTALSPGTVTCLANAYQRGEPLADQPLPAPRVAEDTRRVGPTVRSQLLRMRSLEPQRFRDLGTVSLSGLSQADRLLLSGDAAAAARAYRDEILAADQPLPEAWTGLAFAGRRLAQTPALAAVGVHLPLLFDVHAQLLAREIRCDPLDLAARLS